MHCSLNSQKAGIISVLNLLLVLLGDVLNVVGRPSNLRNHVPAKSIWQKQEQLSSFSVRNSVCAEKTDYFFIF